MILVVMESPTVAPGTLAGFLNALLVEISVCWGADDGLPRLGNFHVTSKCQHQWRLTKAAPYDFVVSLGAFNGKVFAAPWVRIAAM